MTDKAKGNVLFVVALVMLVLTTMLHGGLQVLSGITWWTFGCGISLL